MASKSYIPDKFTLFAEAKAYYNKIIAIISDIENDMSEAAACRKHGIPISSFRDATLCKKKFTPDVTPLEAFELYKEPSWKLYEAIFGEKLTRHSLLKLPIDLEETLARVISEALSDKQQAAINLIYFESQSYNDAAEKLGISSKAVRSLVNTALRKLRMPAYSKRIFYGDIFLLELAHQQYTPEITSHSEETADYLNVSIDALQLSVRVYNCLRRAGLHNVKDVKWIIDKEQLWKVRNLGSKGVSETMLAVNRYIAQQVASEEL